MRTSRDPALPGLVLFTGLVLAGLVTIAIGWKVAARTLLVSSQVPPLVSGGLGGLALVLLGAGFFHVHAVRRDAAVERAELERLLDAAAELVLAARVAKAGR